MNLQYQGIGKTISYFFQKEEKARLMGMFTANKMRGKVEVTYLKDIDNKKYFTVAIVAYEQMNTDGMYGWLNDTLPCRNELFLTVLPDGTIENINNPIAINTKWQQLKPQLEKKHKNDRYAGMLCNGISELLQDKTRLLNAIKYTSPFINTLPPIYGEQTGSDKSPGYRELVNFIGVKTLPIKTLQTNRIHPSGCFEIEVDGELDKSAYDRDKVRELVRVFRNRLRAATEIQLRYKERYLLDELHRPAQSLNMYITSIPGFMFRTETTIFKQITE